LSLHYSINFDIRCVLALRCCVDGRHP